MASTTAEQRDHLRNSTREQLQAHQLQRLNQLLATVAADNPLYRQKLSGFPHQLNSLDQLAELPFTYKEDLQESTQAKRPSANMTYPTDEYVRFHQTSGTRGKPLMVFDTAEDWKWWIDVWQYVLDSADVTPNDRVMMAFSFGPFIGFWSAHDALVDRGCLVVPGGGLSSLARLELMRNTRATLVLCTPSYALHLAEVAKQHRFSVEALHVRGLILAGEPGGSVPATRARIEAAWHAKVYDHSGASEIGPWGFTDSERTGLHVNEAEFIPEFLSIERRKPAQSGELSELVLTNLGRSGFPVLRYRTHDLVRPIWPSDKGFVLLEGGILGRADDMMIIRGVNIFPSAVEQIIHSFPEVHEYRLTATRKDEMDQLSVEIEDQLEHPQRVAEELRVRLGLRVDVTCVPLGSLPRFEGKGKHFIDRRNEASE